MLRLLLDSNILGKVCHPRASANRAVVLWALDCLSSPDHRIVIPEIADFEYRRVLVWRAVHKRVPEAKESLQRLAADLWAHARAHGHTTDDDKAIGVDIILAAQALRCDDTQIVTENRKHLARYVTVFPLEEHLPQE